MMLNDRNDMPDDHEENEYHFSDEDVSYEVETESSKPAPAQQKESLMSRFGQSKRMLISLGVFVVLVFVVYKLVTPSSTSVSTDISTPVVTADQTNTTQSMQQQIPAQAAPPVAVAPPVQPVNPEPTPAVEVAVTPPVGAAPPVQPVASPLPPQEPVAQQQAVATMPPVIAVQQPATEMNAPVGAPAVTQQVTTTTTTMPTAPVAQAAPMPVATQTPVDAATANLAATNDRLMVQLQSDYTQKINDYATQNKMLQDQMQSLSARVSTMEAQLNQLVQALTPQTNQTAAPPPPIPSAPTSMALPPKATIPVRETKIAYSVQAIIPGRAWLRSESGEAITVAEGDTIKDVGRVTKIDPYDGVVEVNTGSRSVSLSYGNGNE